MTQPLQQRANYHPDPRVRGGSDRKVFSRLDRIKSKIDFKDKVVLDLGCSGGFFAFELAKTAKKVIAIDADSEIIERNRNIQNELELNNVEFVCAPITAETILKIGKVDITLFLSVFHHMLALSEAYDWNNGMNPQAADSVIAAVNGVTDTLVFEIGYPNEGYEWCERLPHYGPDWDTFVINHIFQDRYQSVEASAPVLELNWLTRHLLSRLSTPYKRDTRLIQIIKQLFRYDSRDLRKIYFGQKVTSK